MTSSLFTVLLCLRLSVAQDKHYLGGSMSFTFTEFSQVPYKLKVTALTGWTLGQGPCGPLCNYPDVGRNYGKSNFGSWSTQDKYKSTDITVIVISNATGHVFGLNSPLRWEQDVTEFFLDIDPQAEITEIRLTGHYWRQPEYNCGPFIDVPYDLRTDVNSQIRNDTGQPNRSPVASFKPVYKLPLNSRTTLHLSVMDEDDDYITCSQSIQEELGHLRNMPNVNVTRDCSIEISTFESDGFRDGGWGTVAVTVHDLATHDVVVGNQVYYSYQVPFSNIFVKFMVETVLKLDAPAFVPPTRESRHELVVYIGATFTQQLFAKPSSLDIQAFFVRSIPLRRFTVTTPKADQSRMSQGVKYTTVIWRPGVEDVGKYLVTASVADTQWNEDDSIDFVVTVKDLNMTMDQPLKKVYFPFLPNNHSITCIQGSTCIFPVYSRSREGHKIAHVNTTNSSISDIEISSPTKLVNNGQEVYESDVIITPSQGGNGRVCIDATDDLGSRSQEVCISIETEFKDPCRFYPCLNGGRCISHAGNFTCSCSALFSGDICETAIDLCASDPCLNNGRCITVQGRVLIVCDCKPGYTGSRCELNSPCTNGSCQNGGFCDETAHMCQCPVGFTGSRCETTTPAIQTGPTAPSTGTQERNDLDCSGGRMRIHVPQTLLPTHIVTLRDPSCKVASNGSHLLADVGVNECGTTVSFTNDSVIFTNELVATALSGTTAPTIIDYGMNMKDQRVKISCIYPRENRVDFSYVPVMKEAHFYERQYGKLSFDVSQYSDEQFSHAIPHNGLPIGVTLNTELFIDISLRHASHKGVGIMVDSCIATPTSSPADPLWYTVIKDGCPAQQDVRTFASPDVDEFRFSFLVFRFTQAPLQKAGPNLPPTSMVFIHCQVSACPSQNCTNTCNPAGSHRVRREAELENSHLVSAGPFYLKSEEERGGYTGGVVAASVSMAVVATLVAIVALVAWRRSVNKLSKHQTLDEAS